MFAWLQNKETPGALFKENLNPTGDRKFLFVIGVPGLSAGGFLIAIITYFLSI
jgi:hypothetical protein